MKKYQFCLLYSVFLFWDWRAVVTQVRQKAKKLPSMLLILIRSTSWLIRSILKEMTERGDDFNVRRLCQL